MNSERCSEYAETSVVFSPQLCSTTAHTAPAGAHARDLLVGGCWLTAISLWDVQASSCRIWERAWRMTRAESRLHLQICVVSWHAKTKIQRHAKTTENYPRLIQHCAETCRDLPRLRACLFLNTRFYRSFVRRRSAGSGSRTRCWEAEKSLPY